MLRLSCCNRSALGSISIIVIAGALLSFAPHAVAQDKVWHIGWLDSSVPPTATTPSRNLEAFQQALSRLGYAEGRNYMINARFAATDQSRLPALAKELGRSRRRRYRDDRNTHSSRRKRSNYGDPDHHGWELQPGLSLVLWPASRTPGET